MTQRDNLTLLARLSDLPTARPLPRGYTLRPVAPHDDADTLLHLTLAAFAGTIDEQPEPETARDLRRYLDGESAGPFDEAASLAAAVAHRDGELASATLVSHYKDKPLLGYAMTHPAHRGRSLGATLICATGAALARAGHTELALAVTRGNRAVALYKRLGFEEWTPPEDDAPEAAT